MKEERDKDDKNVKGASQIVWFLGAFIIMLIILVVIILLTGSTKETAETGWGGIIQKVRKTLGFP